MHSEDSGGMRITNYGCSSFPSGKVNYFFLKRYLQVTWECARFFGWGTMKLFLCLFRILGNEETKKSLWSKLEDQRDPNFQVASFAKMQLLLHDAVSRKIKDERRRRRLRGGEIQTRGYYDCVLFFCLPGNRDEWWKQQGTNEKPNEKENFRFPNFSSCVFFCVDLKKLFGYRENGLVGMGKSWVWGKDFAEKRVGGGRGENCRERRKQRPIQGKKEGGKILKSHEFPPFCIEHAIAYVQSR